MSGKERREEIVNIIRSVNKPVSGTFLAERFDISRQVIVQDIALLRAEGYDIISTNRGYVIHSSPCCTRIVKVCHNDSEIQTELELIVDCGAVIRDVFVNHKVYGTIRAALNIASRLDVELFLEQIASGKSTPLNNITSGYHYHTLEAQSEEILNLVERRLSEHGFLIEKKNQD